MEKVLLVRTDRIGDVVLTTPAIELLKKNRPDVSISVLVSQYTKDVLKNNPHIDEIITVKPLFKQVKELKQKKFDCCILFFVEPKAALSVFLAGIPKRIGPASKIWSLFLNKMIFQHRSKIMKHEADFNIELLAPLGIKPEIKTPPANAKVFVSDAANEKARNFLLKHYGIKNTDTLICIHPGSKGSAKNWPASHFAELADKIIDQYSDVKVLLSGNNSEQKLLDEISSRTENKPFALNTPLSLEDFIGILNQTKIVVTNSTGPLHIAAALGKKTLSFFPMIKGSTPQRWGPYGQGHIVLTPHEKECPKCKTQNGCMDLISSEEAFKSFQKLVTQ
ncbi:MAG TPA: glycosyltransferase family 9 protein [Elusimicrobiales bacterium]|nr:glycosyltransferase family 9 protein [Elusimicrobiales bacterium]